LPIRAGNPEAALSFVFRRLRRVPAAAPGVGLGLAIAHAIAERHGATIMPDATAECHGILAHPLSSLEGAA